MSFRIGTDAYARHVGRYSAALASAFCERAGVAAGDSVLDVGCGPGPLIAEAARRVGPEKVAGVDSSEPFLAICRAALPGADLRTADAEDLPFGDQSFDVVLSQLVLNFILDARAGVAEMARVARRTVAACVWDYAGGMTMLRAFWDAAIELDPLAPDEARTMRFCTAPELRSLWERAGLRDVATGEIVVAAEYTDFEDYWTPFESGIGPSGAYVAALSNARRDTFRTACFRRLGSPPGPFRLDARAWFVRGTVPGSLSRTSGGDR
ncbi:MAG TPA: methyltransferase domain-containing protein [Planctomycetota bacterium]|jgi:SAM-dependent methyltransferase|nr:methyltransferase domain-containing protein [Planctomycetota bacterium]